MPSRLAPLALCAALACVSPAVATGSLDCSIDDKTASAQIAAVFSYGLGSALSNVRGDLTLKVRGLPAGLPATTFEGEHLVHSWLRGRDIKLHFYRETEGDAPHASIELVVETRGKSADAESYAGGYELIVSWVADGESKSKVFKGKATCGAG
jgi:hypothetical protein